LARFLFWGENLGDAKSLPLIEAYGGHLLLIDSEPETARKTLGDSEQIAADALVSEGPIHEQVSYSPFRRQVSRALFCRSERYESRYLPFGLEHVYVCRQGGMNRPCKAGTPILLGALTDVLADEGIFPDTRL